jgi:hypothetical protein
MVVIGHANKIITMRFIPSQYFGWAGISVRHVRMGMSIAFKPSHELFLEFLMAAI